MTLGDSDPIDVNPEPEISEEPPAGPPQSPVRRLVARLRARRPLTTALALVAVAAVVGGAYVVGSPNQTPGLLDERFSGNVPIAAPTAAPAVPAGGGLNTQSKTQALTPGVVDQTGSGGQSQVFATIDASQIVKTGQMTLEVGEIDAATSQAQTVIAGLGGYVDSSTKSGTGPDATASITFRLPVAKWDQGLAAMRKIGTKDLYEQTNSNDVTSQVIDLNARIDNLKTTEAALQAIMTRTGTVADILAVENQLSETQGQIEELTAARDNLANQAAMSTLQVTFQLPTTTVTTQATEDWTLGSQVDQAVAALVRVGQGLATMAVWLVIVVLPVGLGLLLLYLASKLARRIARRGRTDAVAGA